MITATDLLTMSRGELMGVLQNGHPVEASELEGQQYNGVSLGLPRLVERLTWKKFGKTFHRDGSDGVLRGWNIRMVQNHMDGPWQAKLRDGVPVTFGHYHVGTSDQREGYDRGLTIDYSQSGTARNAMARLRDPIVAVNEGSSELLLGWTYVDLGFKRVGTPSFFSLQRGGELRFIASA